MNASSLSRKKIRIACFLALLASVLLAGLGGYCLKESARHRSGTRYVCPLVIYELSPSGEKTLLFSDKEGIYRSPSADDAVLVAENHSSSPLQVIFEDEAIVLEEQGTDSFSAKRFRQNFQTENEGQRQYFVSDALSLQKALEADETRFVVFQRDISLSQPILFTSPCGIDTGAYRLLGSGQLLYRSDQEGTLTLLSQCDNAVTLYADAPKTTIYTDPHALTYPKNLWDYYLKAESVNGRACDLNRNPVTNEAMLSHLAQSPVREPNADSYIEFCSSFPLSQDHLFSHAYSLRFLAQPQFNDHTLRFTSQQCYTIRVEAKVAVDNSALCIQAPNAHLIWDGNKRPSTETLCETMEVATINREDPEPYRLGGDCKASLLSFTVHHENLVRPISYTLQDKLLVGTLDYLDDFYDLEHATPRYTCENGRLEFEAAHWNEDGTLDLTQRTVIRLIDDEGRMSRYRIESKREYKDLPVFEIETENRAEVESKTEYLNATIRVIANGNGFEDLEPTSVEIRGRGNSTWNWEKKPYKLKFKENLSLFGLAPSNEWVLLSNYADKSLIRNPLAYEMAKELRFSYSPTQYCVDVFVNGRYEGVYSFGEHLEAAEGRIELDNDFDPNRSGYLLEIGGVDSQIHKKGVDYFHAGTLRFALVKFPNRGQLPSAHFDYISDLLIRADHAVVNGGDWRQYLDEDTLVDWILFMELTNNTDGAFRRSCYFTKNADTKLRMGPVWDFDLAFGNFNRDDRSYRSWATTTDDDYVGNTWTAYLLQDREFVDSLFHRWNEIRDPLLQRANEVIDQSAVSLRLSAKENFRRWDVLDIRTEMQHSDVVNYNTHDKQLQYIKDFLTKRASWLDEELTRMHEGGTYEIPEIKKD